MFKRYGLLLFLIGFLSCCSIVLADIKVPPRASKFTSQDGLWGLSIGPSGVSKDIASGRLFCIEPDGSEKDIWKQNLLNAPDLVLVSWHPANQIGSGFPDQNIANIPEVVHVVTIDSLSQLQGKEPIVIYGHRADDIRKCALSELLSEREIRKKLSGGSLEYAADFRFVDNTQLLVEFNWGKKCVIDLSTGKVWNKERLNQALSGDSQKEIYHAFSALHCPKQLNKDVLPGLIATLTNENPLIKGEACEMIGTLGRRAESAVEPLLQVLKHDYSNGLSVKLCVAEALGQIGPGAEVAIPELEKISATTKDSLLRETAEQALRRIRSKTSEK